MDFRIKYDSVLNFLYEIVLEFFLIFLFFEVKKPTKVNESDGNPETLIAAVIADTPGIGTIIMSCLIQSLMRPYPGSLIVGVPASEIKR